MFSKFKKWSSLILLGLLACRADATQLIDNADRQHVQVNISAREANRLAIEGRRIANVVPGQAGQIVGKKDEAQGALYFSLNPDAPLNGTITLFVTDDQSTTYKLILVPRAIAAEEVVLRPPADKPAIAKKATGAADGRATSYQRRLKDLLLVMGDEELQDATVDKVDVNKPVGFWSEGRLILEAKFMQSDYVGEKYRLTNVTSADILLVEQELFRRGVKVVMVRNQTLGPGDSTFIYLVREREENE